MTPGTLPRSLPLPGGDVELRAMRRADEAALQVFATALPSHDLLFLPRDISHPKVLAAWLVEVDRGTMTSIVALRDERIVGDVTIACDPLSWSPHVAEIRLVVLPEMRGCGLGRTLAETGFALALEAGATKIVAQATIDQRAAITVSEEMGYRAEALLKNHVRDRDGTLHDIVVLSLDVSEAERRLSRYGVDRALDL